MVHARRLPAAFDVPKQGFGVGSRWTWTCLSGDIFGQQGYVLVVKYLAFSFFFYFKEPSFYHLTSSRWDNSPASVGSNDVLYRHYSRQVTSKGEKHTLRYSGHLCALPKPFFLYLFTHKPFYSTILPSAPVVQEYTSKLSTPWICFTDSHLCILVLPSRNTFSRIVIVGKKHSDIQDMLTHCILRLSYQKIVFLGCI